MLQIRNGEGSRIAANRRRKPERRAVLAQVRGRIEPPGERGNRETTGEGASRKIDKMSLSGPSLVRAERPKLEFLRKRRPDLRSDAAPSAR